MLEAKQDQLMRFLRDSFLRGPSNTKKFGKQAPKKLKTQFMTY
jgi:hypothetical protein